MTTVLSPEELYEGAKEKLRIGDREETLQLIYRHTNRWARQGKWENLNAYTRLLLLESPSWLAENRIFGLAFLTSTFPFHDKIEYRKSFFVFFHDILALCYPHEEVRQLLHGLEK